MITSICNLFLRLLTQMAVSLKKFSNTNNTKASEHVFQTNPIHTSTKFKTRCVNSART